jgi:hypothetical protein
MFKAFQGYARHIAVSSLLRWIPPTHLYRYVILAASLLEKLENLRWLDPVFGIKIPEHMIVKKDLKQNIIPIILESLRWREVYFPIPIKTEGTELVQVFYKQHSRLVICTGHFPLSRLAHQVLYQLAIPYAMIVTYPPLKLWGELIQPNITLLIASPSVLLKVKQQLALGNMVLAAIDVVKQGQVVHLSPNLLHIARLTETPIVFMATDLTSTDECLVHFQLPTQPLLQSEQDVEACLSEFRQFLNQYSKLPVNA